jgi:hypothetical protein
VQYYATEGIFENEVRIGERTKNGWVARELASGQVVTLWFVARDESGRRELVPAAGAGALAANRHNIDRLPMVMSSPRVPGTITC